MNNVGNRLCIKNTFARNPLTSNYCAALSIYFMGQWLTAISPTLFPRKKGNPAGKPSRAVFEGPLLTKRLTKVKNVSPPRQATRDFGRSEAVTPYRTA